ncbi:uncharacterized protein LOC121417508 isoform X2 [Lytechinus variegatus]|uniref:uncharacterized protein LOC121417508 isoform X2 n=1 Tax=Lytechinus variegatus TaxID=7654 RepID=UPI001BB188D0|nr:uncharacterized protein LOC121417508 isoform X2 [Lytechinus variegatus]
MVTKRDSFSKLNTEEENAATNEEATRLLRARVRLQVRPSPSLIIESSFGDLTSATGSKIAASNDVVFEQIPLVQREVELEVFSESSVVQREKVHPCTLQHEPHASEVEIQAGGYSTEVDFPFKKSDCYISEVDINFNSPDQP